MSTQPPSSWIHADLHTGTARPQGAPNSRSVLHTHTQCIYQYCAGFSPAMKCKLLFIHNANSPVHMSVMQRFLVRCSTNFLTKPGGTEAGTQDPAWAWLPQALPARRHRGWHPGPGLDLASTGSPSQECQAEACSRMLSALNNTTSPKPGAAGEDPDPALL